MRWEVWAPNASSVHLALSAGQRAMHRRPDGWWVSDDIACPADTDYGFVVDGSMPLPDPRSPCQPYGVHGRSRTVDHGAFAWTDARWQPPPLGAGVLYEMHVGTFSPKGTFDGAIERLDHLVRLGISHVEVMPVAEFSGQRGWGYDGVALWAPYHAYGGVDGFKRLVDACHRHGLAVILDVVYNHLGPTGNYLAQFGPYFTDRHRTPWGDAVNLDGRGSDEVRRFFCDNALMWLTHYHVDALRLDAVHALVDTSAVHFIEQLADEVHWLELRLGRHKAIIAESDLNDPRVVTARDAGGFGVDAQWSDDFHHAVHAVLTGERSGYYADFGALEDVARALTDAFVYSDRRSEYRGHRHGRPAHRIRGERFVVSVQNHDQIGNRAAGDRTSHLMTEARLRVAAALLLTAPFIPMLFQGEEWGASTPYLYFTDHDDPELARAVSEGRRQEFAPFGWEPSAVPDPQDPASFDRSRLDWDEIGQPPHAGLLEWHRELIRLRRAVPALGDCRRDAVSVQFDEQARWLVVRRGDVAIACNLGAWQRIPLDTVRAPTLLLGSTPDIRVEAGGIDLPGDAIAIVASGPLGASEDARS